MLRKAPKPLPSAPPPGVPQPAIAAEAPMNFELLMTRESWMYLYLGCGLIFFLLLRPSLLEFVVFNVVDMIALMIVGPAMTPLFSRIYPKSRQFFPRFDLSSVRDLPLDRKQELFQELVRFPRRRAVFSVVASYVKMVPALMVGVFYWKHANTPLVQGALLVTSFSLIYGYFYGAVYIDHHDLVSSTLAEIHRRFDWEDVFRTVDLDSPRMDFHFQESVALAAIALFMGATQIVVVLSSRNENPWQAALMVVSVAGASFFLFGRLWYVARRYFFGGLRSLFDVLEKFDPESSRHHVLPLHSAALLAQFERTFNELTRRLRVYEEEFSHWLFVQSEQSRFRALGEVSALIVHDLSSPLQVVNFCAESMNESLPEEKRERYLEQLVQNSQRSLELISSWKAYLKNQNSDTNFISFRECLEYVRTLLSTQFEPKKFHALVFDADPALNDSILAVPRAEMIHILVNIVSNSTENLIQNAIVSPRLEFKLEAMDEEWVRILIRDNGTGLSPERFEELTSFMYLSRPGMPARGGLGLRLVRRLIERRGGTLDVLPPQGAGTTFRLAVKRG